MRCPSCGNLNRPEARFCDACGTPLAEAPKQPAAADSPGAPGAIGALIDGRYRIEAFLGRGGRKRVYRAADVESPGRTVAIAVFDTEGIGEAALARSRREAQAMSRLGEHPHIVTVLGTGEHEGTPYVVSEYVGGGDLSGVLEACAGRRLELDRAVGIVIDVCRALEHAHARGVIHRDLKPANVWLGDDDAARLGDFGLATTDRRSRAAVEGMLVGTVAYLPPELALGRAADARSDLYSLGAMFYELLTGEPPFPGDDAVAIIGQHLSAPPVAPSRHRDEVSPAIDDVVLRLLAKVPEDRPQSAAEARREIEAAAAAPAGDEHDDADNPLESLAGGVFVGREAELGSARGVLEDALAGQGRLLLVSGDPGIGKTRTAEQLATYARVRGARVYWGRCYETRGQPPYWPWSEAIRGYVMESDPVGLRWQLGPRAADIARIVPELAERLDIEVPDQIETEQARFRLFDSVATFLTDASKARPTVIVLDDLHWADEPSLHLLSFITRRMADSGLLLVGTYRDVELGRHHHLAETLENLAGSDCVRRVGLRGLAPGAIADYIELTAGVDRPPADLAQAIAEQTGGNPFFIGEVVRLMASEGRLGESAARREVRIPQGVRQVVGRRLDHVSPVANEVLGIASIYGRDFSGEVIEAVSERPATEVRSALDEAVESRLIEARPNDPGHYTFSHALVRETLLAEIPTAKRVRLHGLIAEALEKHSDDDDDRHLSELAHHFLEAAPLGEVDRAIDYATRGAVRAAQRFAHEDAANLYEKALETLEMAPPVDPVRRLDLLLELGTAQIRASRLGEARQTLVRAATVARELDRPEDLARAALQICLISVAGVVDESLIDLLSEALDAIGPQDGPVRSQLLSGLAQALYWTDPSGRSDELGIEAVEMARRIGDSDALAQALVRRQFTGGIGPEQTLRRLREADELHDLAKRLGDLELELRAHVYRLAQRLAVGDVAGMDADLAAYERLADLLRQPQHSWHVPLLKATRAMIDGRFDDAERLCEEAFVAGQRAEEPVSAQFHMVQVGLLRRLRRRPDDLAAAASSIAELTELAEKYEAIPAWRCSLAITHAELGNKAEARAAFESLAANRFDAIPSDAQFVVSMSLLAEVADFLDDSDRAQVVYELLLPYDGLNVVAGRAAASNGPVARYLGLLAEVCGRVDDAERHYAAALEMTAAMGDRPFGARAHFGLARLLLTRDAPGDRDRALELLREAVEVAQEIGMEELVRDAIAARLEAQGLGALDVSTSIDYMIDAVAAEQPDIAAHAAPDGQVTILFSDIEDSTVITERLGDERWLRVLRAHNTLFRRLVRSHGGYEVKNQGDGFMLVFPQPDRALKCAAAIQRALSEGEAVEGERVRVRIGMHAGEAISEDGDFFGRSVIVAARIAAQARGGEILVSEELKSRAEDGDCDSVEFDDGREIELKGLAGTHRVYRANWEQPVPA
jgi:class 3 adenylate cyclase